MSGESLQDRVDAALISPDMVLVAAVVAEADAADFTHPALSALRAKLQSNLPAATPSPLASGEGTEDRMDAAVERMRKMSVASQSKLAAQRASEEARLMPFAPTLSPTSKRLAGERRGSIFDRQFEASRAQREAFERSQQQEADKLHSLSASPRQAVAAELGTSEEAAAYHEEAAARARERASGGRRGSIFELSAAMEHKRQEELEERRLSHETQIRSPTVPQLTEEQLERKNGAAEAARERWKEQDEQRALAAAAERERSLREKGDLRAQEEESLRLRKEEQAAKRQQLSQEWSQKGGQEARFREMSQEYAVKAAQKEERKAEADAAALAAQEAAEAERLQGVRQRQQKVGELIGNRRLSIVDGGGLAGRAEKQAADRAAEEQKVRDEKAALKKKRERARRRAQAGPSKNGSAAIKDTRASRARTATASSRRLGAGTGAERGSGSGAGVVDRLTNPSLYTGAHKKRFGQGGGGLGLLGRRDSQPVISDLSTVLKTEHVNTGGSFGQNQQRPSRRPSATERYRDDRDEGAAMSRNAGIHTITEDMVTDVSTTDESDDDSGLSGNEDAGESQRDKGSDGDFSPSAGSMTDDDEQDAAARGNTRHRSNRRRRSLPPTGDIVDRLTDTTQYTGAHKKRFSQGGRGLGLAGRRDSQAVISDLSMVVNTHKTQAPTMPPPKHGARSRRGASTNADRSNTAKSASSALGSQDGTSIFDKLTDASAYTGAHRSRFTSSGKGRGLVGRKDSQAVISDISMVLNDHKNIDPTQKTVVPVASRSSERDSNSTSSPRRVSQSQAPQRAWIDPDIYAVRRRRDDAMTKRAWKPPDGRQIFGGPPPILNVSAQQHEGLLKMSPREKRLEKQRKRRQKQKQQQSPQSTLSPYGRRSGASDNLSVSMADSSVVSEQLVRTMSAVQRHLREVFARMEQLEKSNQQLVQKLTGLDHSSRDKSNRKETKQMQASLQEELQANTMTIQKLRQEGARLLSMLGDTGGDQGQYGDTGDATSWAAAVAQSRQTAAVRDEGRDRHSGSVVDDISEDGNNDDPLSLIAADSVHSLTIATEERQESNRIHNQFQQSHAKEQVQHWLEEELADQRAASPSQDLRGGTVTVYRVKAEGLEALSPAIERSIGSAVARSLGVRANVVHVEIFAHGCVSVTTPRQANGKKSMLPRKLQRKVATSIEGVMYSNQIDEFAGGDLWSIESFKDLEVDILDVHEPSAVVGLLAGGDGDSAQHRVLRKVLSQRLAAAVGSDSANIQIVHVAPHPTQPGAGVRVTIRLLDLVSDTWQAKVSGVAQLNHRAEQLANDGTLASVLRVEIEHRRRHGPAEGVPPKKSQTSIVEQVREAQQQAQTHLERQRESPAKQKRVQTPAVAKKESVQTPHLEPASSDDDGDDEPPAATNDSNSFHSMLSGRLRQSGQQLDQLSISSGSAARSEETQLEKRTRLAREAKLQAIVERNTQIALEASIARKREDEAREAAELDRRRAQIAARQQRAANEAEGATVADGGRHDELLGGIRNLMDHVAIEAQVESVEAANRRSRLANGSDVHPAHHFYDDGDLSDESSPP